MFLVVYIVLFRNDDDTSLKCTWIQVYGGCTFVLYECVNVPTVVVVYPFFNHRQVNYLLKRQTFFVYIIADSYGRFPLKHLTILHHFNCYRFSNSFHMLKLILYWTFMLQPKACSAQKLLVKRNRKIYWFCARFWKTILGPRNTDQTNCAYFASNVFIQNCYLFRFCIEWYF